MNKFLRLNPKSPEILTKYVTEVLEVAKSEIKAISALPKNQKRTAENTLEPLNRAYIVISAAIEQMSLFSAVHPNKKIRETAEVAEQNLAKFFPKIYLRPDLYKAIKNVPAEGLDEDTKRFIQKELLDFKLTGVDKSEKVRKEIQRLIQKEVKLGQTFDRNIKDDVRYVKTTEEELAGLPEDYVKAHRSSSEIINLSTQYPDYLPVMEYAINSSLRKRFNTEYLNRGWPKNDRVFKDLLSVRKKHAKLVGFSNWADYVTADKMTKNAKTVRSFLDKVALMTVTKAKKDYELLLNRKRKDYPNATSFGSWESVYYDNLISKELGFDPKEIREYLQYGLVKNGVLNSVENLLGLKFKKIKIKSWHKDVENFDIYRKGKILGRFYLDMHPREGKYGHAACFSIRSGIRDLHLPEAALICNFSKKLMGYDDVITFFHEFGHLMHFILAGNQKWNRFSGFSTEWDFVEAPSQMLEACGHDAKTLKKFARHYKTNKIIPDKLLNKMKETESLNRGLWQSRQAALASLSLRYHIESPQKINLSSVMNSELKKFNAVEYPEGTHFYAGFGHLNGYSAMYYTYLWSRAIAEDILSPFKKDGMYNKKVSKLYVDNVLSVGGSKDANVMIKNFLGREWNLKAFSEWLGK